MEDKNLHKIFEEVYQLQAKAIFRFVYFKVSDYELAQDITAETFLRFWKVLSGQGNIQNRRALLYTISNGLVIDYYRKAEHKKKVAISKIDENLVFVTDSLEEKLDAKTQLQQVLAALQKIKKEYRDVLLLYYVDELEVSEIAFIVKKKENAVRVLIHRALKALKDVL